MSGAQAARVLLPFLAVYVAAFAAFGVASPFLPSFLVERGLTPSQIGVLLASGTAIRLISAPLAAQVADRWNKPRAVLVASLAASAAVALLYLPATTFMILAGVSLLHAAALAPLTPTADAMALAQRKVFDYGWVRGAGSAAFVAGTFVSGAAIDRFGLASFLWLNAGWLAIATIATLSLPVPPAQDGRQATAKPGDIRALLANRTFLLTVTVATLILASHAMHDAFAVIRWRAAGFSNGLVSVLWSEAVVAEVVVFTLVGPWMLQRWNPASCAALAALAGCIRWAIISQTLAPALIACVEPLHGVTFALLHLACMRIIADIVPAGLGASAQAFYGTVAAGAGSALVTLAAGPLYGRFGGEAFLAMSALCLLAVPLALLLRRQLILAHGAPIHEKIG